MKRYYPVLACFALLAMCLLGSNTASARWDKIPKAELESTECAAYPDMAAEILFKLQILDEGEYENRFNQYHYRLKIYDESAVEKVRKIRVFYDSETTVSGLAARVVKPDGRSYELKKEDIFQKQERKTSSRTLYSKSFSLPNLEAGDILEYKFKRVLDTGYYTPRMFVTFQEEWPIRKLELKIRPYIATGVGFKWIRSNCNTDLKKRGNGYYQVVLEDLAPYPSEPDSMPDRYEKANFQFFEVMNMSKGESYWTSQSRDLFRKSESHARADATIKAKAKEITAGIDSSEEKLRALYDYCRTDFRNARHGTPGLVTADERKKIESNDNAAKILKNGYGNPYNCNVLFCALAKAAGFDARLALSSDRSHSNFTRVIENAELAMPHKLVAIKSNEDWRFFDPGSRYVRFGKLKWQNQGATLLVANKKDPIFVKTDPSPASFNKQIGTGNLELKDDGTLLGKVGIEMTGNYNVDFQAQLDGQSPKKRKETIRSSLEEQFHNALFRDIELENVAEPNQNIRISFTIEIPQYAESIGDRLVVNPNLFYRYDDQRYTDDTRYTGLFYQHRFQYVDKVEIKLPEGYALDQASAPRPFTMEHLLDYQPKLSLKRKSNTLVYSRTLDFEGVSFKKEAYRLVKRAFDQIYAQDQHSITIKKVDTSLSSSEASTQSSKNG